MNIKHIFKVSTVIRLEIMIFFVKNMANLHIEERADISGRNWDFCVLILQLTS